jgi:hypothetical protein
MRVSFFNEHADGIRPRKETTTTMKLLRTRGASHGEPLEIKQVFVPDVQIAVVEAVRVWSDARGKTHFEYLAVRKTREPQSCSHGGTLSVRGRRVPYVWARSSAFRLRCGDCGTEL